MIYYFVAAQESYAMKSFLSSWGKGLTDQIKIVTYEAFFAGQQQVPESGASYIFSTFGLLQRMGSEKYSTICDLHARLVNACGPAKVLNDPRKALSRYEFLRTLFEKGINRFNVYRLHEVPFRFPVFVRREAGTEYNEPQLLHKKSDYDMTVQWATWMWKSLDGLVAIEFCDTADPSGLFRKYGAFVVGGRIVPRHVFFSRSWLVKLADLTEPSMIEEELAYLDHNPHAELLLECARIAQILYGRIDYGLLDGHPQIWEININPMLASQIANAIPARRSANLKFVAMITQAFAALDAGYGVR